ncbi:MAG: hypothetical protein O3B01_02275 [Planctomycetota bacterium]|nr:hypothetical protein [Planctomycetota bacterium]MDA1137385.1 hypothetical protein [Planctomycetota bacterium]
MKSIASICVILILDCTIQAEVIDPSQRDFSVTSSGAYLKYARAALRQRDAIERIQDKVQQSPDKWNRGFSKNWLQVFSEAGEDAKPLMKMVEDSSQTDLNIQLGNQRPSSFSKVRMPALTVPAHVKANALWELARLSQVGQLESVNRDQVNEILDHVSEHGIPHLNELDEDETYMGIKRHESDPDNFDFEEKGWNNQKIKSVASKLRTMLKDDTPIGEKLFDEFKEQFDTVSDQKQSIKAWKNAVQRGNLALDRPKTYSGVEEALAKLANELEDAEKDEDEVRRPQKVFDYYRTPRASTAPRVFGRMPQRFIGVMASKQMGHDEVKQQEKSTDLSDRTARHDSAGMNGNDEQSRENRQLSKNVALMPGATMTTTKRRLPQGWGSIQRDLDDIIRPNPKVSIKSFYRTPDVKKAEKYTTEAAVEAINEKVDKDYKDYYKSDKKRQKQYDAVKEVRDILREPHLERENDLRQRREAFREEAIEKERGLPPGLKRTVEAELYKKYFPERRPVKYAIKSEQTYHQYNVRKEQTQQVGARTENPPNERGTAVDVAENAAKTAVKFGERDARTYYVESTPTLNVRVERRPFQYFRQDQEVGRLFTPPN